MYKVKPYPALHRKIHRRVWLNPPKQGGSAHIMWGVDPPTGTEKSYDGASAEFSIADCHRSVSLDFPTYGDELPRSIAKANRLLTEVLSFRNALLGIQERKKELRQAKK